MGSTPVERFFRDTQSNVLLFTGLDVHTQSNVLLFTGISVSADVQLE